MTAFGVAVTIGLVVAIFSTTTPPSSTVPAPPTPPAVQTQPPGWDLNSFFNALTHPGAQGNATYESRWHYNHQRPHQSLADQLPAEVYQALPKVGPGDPRPRRRKTGPRVLVVSPTGSVNYRKRRIGIGQQWKGQRVTVIETKPDHVVVLGRTTGTESVEGGQNSGVDTGSATNPTQSQGT